MTTRAVSDIRPPRSYIAQGCAYHVVSCLDAAREWAGHLGAAVTAMAIVNGEFKDAIPRSRRLNQHFDRPAEGLFAHLKRIQHGATYDAERAYVMKLHAIQDGDHPAHQPVAQTGLRRDCATFGAFAHTRTDNQVGAPFAHGCQHHGQVGGVVTPVSIHKNDKLSTQAARRSEAFQASKSVASCWFAGD